MQLESGQRGAAGFLLCGELIFSCSCARLAFFQRLVYVMSFFFDNLEKLLKIVKF